MSKFEDEYKNTCVGIKYQDLSQKAVKTEIIEIPSKINLNKILIGIFLLITIAGLLTIHTNLDFWGLICQ